MPAREGSRGGNRRQRPRTVPDLSLSPIGRGGAPGANGIGLQPSAAAAGRGGRGRSRGRPVPTVRKGDKAAAVAPAERPELLSRFIPADPWVGRVSLSSPQPPGGLSLSAATAGTATAAAAAAAVKPGGGSGGASSTVSPNPVANGTSNNITTTTTTTISTIGVSGGSTNEHAGGAGAGAGAKGVVGLMNEGNWCYLNASLQALARCAPFRAHLVECVPTPDVAGRPCPLAFAMSELYSEMWAEGRAGSGSGGGARRAATPSDVLRALVKGNRWFAGNGQHDAHEALRSILDLLHEELRRPVPASFEPGHAALTAAMAASAAESAAAAAATAPATAAPDDPKQTAQPAAGVVAAAAATGTGGGPALDSDKLKQGGKATIPSTPADGTWSANGCGVGVERRSTERVTSGDSAVVQHRDVYWQSAAAETFQGVLLGRITCRTCGRHSDQPDRFYDLSVPLLAASAGSASATATNGGAAGAARTSATTSAAAAAAARGGGGGVGHRSRGSPEGGVTPTMESPRPEWEPSDANTDIHGHGAMERRTASARSLATATESEAAGGDRTSDWGGWRRTRGGWCSAARDDDDDGSRDSDGSGGRRGRGGGGGSGAGAGAPVGYLGGLVSSVGVWLGLKSVALEDCLEAFFSPERLRGANQYHCDGCGSLKEADKSTSLLHAPEILVLHVKRFRRGYLWSHKVHNRVIFPLHDLDVSRWLSDHAAESSANQRAPAGGGSGGDAHRKSSVRRNGGGSPDGGGYYGGSTATAAAAAASESVAAAFAPSLPAPVLYDLVGLVQHTGGLEHGHYTSYTRDDGSATWHHFNDTVATKVSQETVSSASPYILVYRRKRPSPSWPGVPTQSMRSSAEATASAGAAAAASASLLSSVGIGPAAEEARDVRSRVDIMAREMSKANSHRAPSSTANNASSGAGAGTIGADAAAAAAAAGAAAAAAAGESQHRMSIGGGVSDTDGEGAGGGGRRVSTGRRRKGRGRRPGSESESEGGTGGSNSWVYMSKAWALKWATSAYPGPVSNHHVVCRHGRIKPNVGIKRATREMVAVPRGVHRSLVNRYGPRTPAVVAGKPAPPDVNGFKATPGPGESAGRVSVGRGRGRGQGMALVGSSRPLLELTSCTACAALEEEMALAKSTEQKEVAALSKVGQERRKRRKAARLARQRRRNSAPTPDSDPRRASRSGMVVGAAGDTATGAEGDRGKEGGGGEQAGDEVAAARNASAGSGGVGGVGGGEAEGGVEEERTEEVKGEREGTLAKAGDAAAAGVGGGDESDKSKQASEAADPGGGVSPGGSGLDGDEPDQQREGHRQEQQPREQVVAVEEEGEHGEEEEGEDEEEEEEKWYLMAGTWLSRWHAYVLSGTGEDLDFPTPPPGPITNGDLVDEESVPIPGKIAGKHYRGAMTEVWRYLHERYGGGPVICRGDPDGLYE